MSHYFERPKFKSIIHYYLNQFCDMDAQLENLGEGSSNMMQQFPAALKKSMRLFIIEIIPTILVSDGHNFIEAIFTKESINDFRKNYSHVKFSNLRDKVIYVSKWQLQLDHADSKKQFNSFQNINIKFVIEQFKPLMHESLNTRLTHSATSIFRNPDIQTLVKNYRHWFAQTLINKNAVNSQFQGIALPSLNELFGNSSKGKKNSQNEQKTYQNQSDSRFYSQNTTQFSQNDNNVGDDFGGNIQKSQIFRINATEFSADIKIDSHSDFDEFKKQVLIKKTEISSELRLADIDRIVIQEKGEQFYAEKNFSKSRQWLEQVQDEYRRDELKMQIEYFQVGSQSSKFDSHFETMWQREEREKQQKKFSTTGYRSRRIVGYTLGYTASSIKEKLIRMLDSTKTNTANFQDYANKHISKAKSISPQKGRPRSNSQENLLQLNNFDAESKSQLIEQAIDAPICREPLSQFVQHQMPIFHDDDTQSEADSMDNAIEAQLQRERREAPKEDKVFDNMKPMGISVYKSYLEWFQLNDISHQSYIQRQNERDFEEEARQEQIMREKQEADSKRFSFRLVEKNKPKEEIQKVQEDVEMSYENDAINQIIEQKPMSFHNSNSKPQQDIIMMPESMPEFSKPEDIESPIKQQEQELQLEQSEEHEQEIEMKEESGKSSPIQQMTKLPKEETSPVLKHYSPELQRSPSIEQRSPSPEPQRSPSPERQRSPSPEPQRSPSPEPQREPERPTQPSVTIERPRDNQAYETPSKPIIDINMGMSPPKPIHLMSTGEKAMWDLEVQFQQMKEEMERKQREMMQMYEMKRKEALKIKEEEERKEKERKERIERERIEKERQEKERVEKERRERERIEKERRERERIEKERKERERVEKERQERIEKERKERERQERERLEKERAMMRAREQSELKLMRAEEASLIDFYAEEHLNYQRQQEQLMRLELERKIQMEKERLRREDQDRQEQRQKLEMERLENDKKQRLIDAQASQAKITQEAVEAEKKRRMLMLQEEKRRQQEMEDDWGEGQQNSSNSSFDDDYIKQLDMERDAYIKNMNKKFGNTLNQEIRRMETKDMTRRKIKKVENEDKLYDFVKIKNIKQEKIEQQRRQLENSSSSQPSKDSKESKAQVADESSEKLSSSKSEGDADLNQYDLFDNKNDEDLPDDESIQEITQSQLLLDTPPQQKQIESYPKKDENTKIQELSAQIAMLQQQLGLAVQSIKVLSSQSQLKDAQKASAQNEDEEDSDYHLPAFGSQVSPKKKNIEPFNLGKRNYSQYEEEQQYRQYENEYKNSPTKQTQFKNLTEFVNYKQMERHKTNIQNQHMQREQKLRMIKQQRQGPSQSQPRSSSAGSSQGVQGGHPRQRERSQSRENMRPPQQPGQGQNFGQRPQMPQQQQHRPSHQQQQIQQQYRSSQNPQGARPSGGQPPRQRSGSPVKQPQQPLGMNVAGSKRYVHSQNPGGQQPQYMRQKMQAPSQNYNDPQTLKRRKIVIEDDDQ